MEKVPSVKHENALDWATLTPALRPTEIYEWNNTAIRVDGKDLYLRVTHLNLLIDNTFLSQCQC